MIASNIRFTNFDAKCWRNLGDFYDCIFPKCTILWILYNGDMPVRAVIDDKPCPLPALHDIGELFRHFEEADCIVTVQESCLRGFYHDINGSVLHSPMDAQQFYSFATRRLWNERGIRYHLRRKGALPPPPWVDSYGLLNQMVLRALPRTGHFLLEIADGESPWFHLYLRLLDGEIAQVSSFDEFCPLLGLNEIDRLLTDGEWRAIRLSLPGEVRVVKEEKQAALVWFKRFVAEHVYDVSSGTSSI